VGPFWERDDAGRSVSLRVVAADRLSRPLSRYRDRLRAFGPGHVIVEAMITDNHGITNRAALVVSGSDRPRLSAVYVDELFEE